MNRTMKAKRAYWIGGTIAAFLGVTFVRLLSPELAGVYGSVAAAAGYALVIAGITIIAGATRREDSEAFITMEKNGKD